MPNSRFQNRLLAGPLPSVRRAGGAPLFSFNHESARMMLARIVLARYVLKASRGLAVLAAKIGGW